MKTFLKILGILAIVLVLAVGGFALFMNNGTAAAKNLKPGAATPAGLADGSYEGAYSGGRFSNKVKVTVKDGKITNIDAVQTVTFEKPETTAALFSGVIAVQSTDVDALTGATLTCNAYLKSVANALGGK